MQLNHISSSHTRGAKFKIAFRLHTCSSVASYVSSLNFLFGTDVCLSSKFANHAQSCLN